MASADAEETPTPCSGPERVWEPVAWPSVWSLGRKSYIMGVFSVGGDAEVCSTPAVSFGYCLKSILSYQHILLCSIILMNFASFIDKRLKVHYIFLVLLILMCVFIAT